MYKKIQQNFCNMQYRWKKRHPMFLCAVAVSFWFAFGTAAVAAPSEGAAGLAHVDCTTLNASQLADYMKELEQYQAQLAAYSQALAAQNAAPAQLQFAQTAIGVIAQKQAEAAAWAAALQTGVQAVPQPGAAPGAQSVIPAAPQPGTGSGVLPVVPQVPEGRLIAAGLQNNAPDSFFKGKSVSILGDSISTYQGYIPEGYACFYPDAGNNVKDVTQTWWMQVLYNTGMRLAVNGSYSASAVCGDSRSQDSSAGCSNRRLTDLIAPDGTVPDVILVYMGANDFFHSIELGKFSGIAEHRTDHYIWDFTEAYELMLQKLQAIYPNSRIYCMTLIEANSSDHPRVNANGNTIADFNRRIKEIAAAHAVPVIDVHGCGMEVYELNRYTSDGTHPNQEGSARMAAYVTNALLMGG